jgi:hypothetical protein
MTAASFIPAVPRSVRRRSEQVRGAAIIVLAFYAFSLVVYVRSGYAART